jgi:hypothetical protein
LVCTNDLSQFPATSSRSNILRSHHPAFAPF